ncbi:hypothetical protein OJ997_02310 [Solirubrobacter phytolaccae]|uniref:ScyD/ScyE family protein n=1 Tax=Solirubrobacter phytolaccae TaxID=1404360 RepID=A0A9X3N3U8_9ACTN|nr:hypothetical protein [Solirubrobacter phytolaccae]MDA0179114.1 hypothetical protein [Solirubrobacter phytolaccae]
MRAMFVVAALGLAVATPAAHADVTTQYFALPAGIASTTGALEVTPDGNVFFGGSDNTEEPPIGRVNTAQVTPGTSTGITGLKTPDAEGCCSSQLRDMTWSAKDARLYFTRSDRTVGKLVGDTVTLGTVPVAPWGIAAAPGGGAWMAEYSAGPGTADPFQRLGSRMAFVAPDLTLGELPSLQTYTGTYYSIRFDALPRGVTVAPDGTPWFTQANPGNAGYRVAKVTGGSYVEYDAPCGAGSPCSGSHTGTGLTDVAVAPDGAVWYTNELKRAVTRMVPGASQVEYPLDAMGLVGGIPRSIAVGADGGLWLAVGGAASANAIVRVDAVSLQATLYRLGSANAPLNAVPDTARGTVWFVGGAGAGGTAIGRLVGLEGIAPPTGGGGGGGGPETGGEGTVVTPPGTAPTPTTTTVLTGGTVATASVSKPSVKGDSITANQICVGPPQDKCSLVYLVQTREYVKGFPGAHSSAAKLTTIGKATVTLNGGQSKKVTIKLNSKGKKLRKKLKSFKATLTVTQTVKGTKKPKQVLKKNVTFKRGG